jgi:hypothetical protein
MSRNRNSGFFLVALLVVVGASARADEPATMFVQSIKGDLRSGPKMDASRVDMLFRGDELSVVERKDSWVHAKHGKIDGWISRLFLSDHKPVGQADLARDVSAESVEKSSRKRSSEYAVAAATRGLVESGNRVRAGRENFESDYQALGQVDELKVSDADLDKFRRSARLSAD